MPIFHRNELADEISDKIMSLGAASAASSGLFLAAPRRTGKSTFLIEDLRPKLQAKGALTVYADLWEDRRADPGDVILRAVRAEIAKHEGVVKRLVRAAGMEKVDVAGLSFSLDKIGADHGISLTAALAALSDATKQLIVLIIDEAQHAITSDKGNDALFALKAARDRLNSSLHHGLRVVATGSNRDKLAMLRNSREQAFFGAPLVNFPPLGEDYVRWFCERAQLAAPLNPTEVYELFKRASHRPEVLGAAADTLRFAFGAPAQNVPERFAAAVAEQIAASNNEFLHVIHSLTPLQSAVLRVMAKRGASYAPFEEATLDAYQVLLRTTKGRDAKADVSSVQQALVALQEKALVWRAARGVYAIEESSLTDIMEHDGLLDFET